MAHDILIVDDESDIRLLIAGILSDEGKDQIGQSSFYIIPWKEFTQAGLYIHIYENIKTVVQQSQPSVVHWPGWNEPYHPTWPKETLEHWVKNDIGTQDQINRYMKDLAWYDENKQ